MEVCKESQNHLFKHTPTFFEEGHSKAIWTRSLWATYSQIWKNSSPLTYHLPQQEEGNGQK